MSVPESAVEFMSGLIERSRKLKRRIAFPEGTDPRVLEAARRLARDGLVKPILIGKPPAQAPDGVTFIDPSTSPALKKYAEIYHDRRRARGITRGRPQAWNAPGLERLHHGAAGQGIRPQRPHGVRRLRRRH